MTTAATHELRATLRVWAEARGYLSTPFLNAEGRGPQLDGIGWVFHPMPEHASCARNAEGVTGARLDYWTAALWALLVDSGLRVDVGECPTCRARSATRGKLARWEWYAGVTYGAGCDRWWVHSSHKEDLVERFGESVQCGHRESGPVRDTPNVRRGGLARTTQVIAVYPCPACTVDGEPTGRNMRDAAQLLLDAAPKRGYVNARKKSGKFYYPGDPDARAQLAILAEGLLERSSDLGELLAAWLAPVESDARAQYQGLILWCVTLAAVQIAQDMALGQLAYKYAGIARYEYQAWHTANLESDAELRARVLDALRESRPKRITHARTPQNRSA